MIFEWNFEEPSKPADTNVRQVSQPLIEMPYNPNANHESHDIKLVLGSWILEEFVEL